jgi:hypothetical protein
MYSPPPPLSNYIPLSLFLAVHDLHNKFTTARSNTVQGGPQQDNGGLPRETQLNALVSTKNQNRNKPIYTVHCSITVAQTVKEEEQNVISCRASPHSMDATNLCHYTTEEPMKCIRTCIICFHIQEII